MMSHAVPLFDTECRRWDTTAECHCNSERACAMFPSILCNEVGSHDKCQEGWFGPYCQIQNVAFRKNTSQTSTYKETSRKTNNTEHRFIAEYAVDGRHTTTFYSKPFTCSHTTWRYNSTWTVYVKTEKIQHIRLYLRRDHQNRNNGLEILVNGHMCHSWKSGQHPPPEVNVTCHKPLIGNKVQIRIPSKSWLTLCEVLILVCGDGWFGDDCVQQCNCLSSTEICDKVTGQCISGCAPGFIGPECQTPCSGGYYGINCSSRCGNCLDTNVCNKTTGSCPRNCAPGWLNDTCLQACLDGFYGINCSSTCGNCLDPDVCNKTTGSCPGECAPGWLNDTCLQPCEDGMFGGNCTSVCGHCQNSACENTQGTCVEGCIGNFATPQCQACLDGFYGINCSSTCGNCLDPDVCNKTTGSCPGECAPGWLNDTCLQQASTQSPVDDYVTPMVGGVVAVMLVLAAVVAVIVICRKRNITKGKREELHGGESMHSQYDVITMVDNSGNGEEPNVYEGLDDGPMGASPALPLDDEPARASPATPFDDEPAGALPGPLTEADDEDAMFSVESDVDDVTEAAANYYNWIPPHMTLGKLHQCLMAKKEKSSFEAEFQAIPYGARRPHEVGKKPENKMKNRFVALYAYDHSRVVLTDGSDYINANYITGHDDTPTYIATQGPTHVTIADFWQMIWQENVTEIVMLTNLMEKKKKKCEQYWPAENKSNCYGDFSITNKKAVVRAEFITSTFVVKKSIEERVVRHFHFTSWPDHGVPSAPALVSFWRMVKQEGKKGRPMVIHCSAGVGRTGTFIALDHLMEEAENENKVNVFMCVGKMREDRMNMVQTVSQYEFVHDVVLEAIRSRGTFFTSPEFETEFGQGETFTEPQETKLRKQFQLLQESTSSLSEETVSTALLPQNAAKNRSRTILPGNKTRPHLTTRVHQRNNYINAVVLSSILRPSSLIVSQTPLPDTVVDFWRLVYDHDCCTVICLDDSKEVENVYPTENQNLKKGPFTIVLQKENSNREGYRERILTVLYDKEGCERSVVVFSLKSLDMMSHPATLLELVNIVHMVITSADHKVLVHCHDGARVSGVFCSVLNIISRLRLDRDVDIFLSIRELQCVRPQFIQSFEDYQLCYSIVKEYNRDAGIYANV
ncbi:receptor-type tyrosine-protein phosphatase mu-like [Haliotis cracherodii]|uniref:receptor-type tyrosine-protein phosphatase mu-like n=1 Tax=Haliotis cracherodii TaxID=6455 RepID=UPI0039EAACAE